MKYRTYVSKKDCLNSDGTITGWKIILDNKTEINWEGFYVGPVILSPEEISSISNALIGFDNPERILEIVKDELCFYSFSEEYPRAIILHSATASLRCFEKDLMDLISSKHLPDDVATYLETRSICLARSGDLVVGRTHTWRTAAALAGVEALTIPNIEYYYLSHALLKLSSNYHSNPSHEIEHLLEVLRRSPTTVIRLYTLDREMQIFLLWLKRLSKLPVLYIDANSLEITEQWNRKDVLHPTVRESFSIDLKDIHQKTFTEILEIETSFTKIYKELDIRIPVLPGYVIEGEKENLSSVIEQVVIAARMLKERYGIKLGCLKPTNAGGGVRIIPGIDLNNEALLKNIIQELYVVDSEDFILEANINYSEQKICWKTLSISPSTHIRHGRVEKGLSLQIVDGTTWQGNLYLDEETCEDFRITIDQYKLIIETTHALLNALRKGKNKVAIAGFDFAIGSIESCFENKTLVVIQDLNVRFHGAEFMRIVLDDCERRELFSPNRCYVATRVFRPSFDASLSHVKLIADRFMTKGFYAKALASIPGRWGIVATAAETPTQAFNRALLLIDELIEEGLVYKD